MGHSALEIVGVLAPGTESGPAFDMYDMRYSHADFQDRAFFWAAAAASAASSSWRMVVYRI
jgi:hypothetical protein